MRFTLAILAIVTSSVSATVISRQYVPACATDCLLGSNVDLDGCSPTDNVCLCQSKTFISTYTMCVGKACSVSDRQVAISAVQQICASVGVTLSCLPTPTA